MMMPFFHTLLLLPLLLIQKLLKTINRNVRLFRIVIKKHYRDRYTKAVLRVHNIERHENGTFVIAQIIQSRVVLSLPLEQAVKGPVLECFSANDISYLTLICLEDKNRKFRTNIGEK